MIQVEALEAANLVRRQGKLLFGGLLGVSLPQNRFRAGIFRLGQPGRLATAT